MMGMATGLNLSVCRNVLDSTRVWVLDHLRRIPVNLFVPIVIDIGITFPPIDVDSCGCICQIESGTRQAGYPKVMA
jgi:hypothetical protein